MAITKNIVDIPLPESSIDSWDILKNYVNTVASVIASALGYVIREDLTADCPSYAPYSYIKYFAKTAEDTPEFAFMNNNSEDNRVNIFLFCVVNKLSETYVPIAQTGYYYSNTCTKLSLCGQYSLVNLYNKKHQIETIILEDGRRIVTFNTINSDLTDATPGNSFSVLLGNGVYVNGTLYNVPILFVARFLFPYIEEADFIDEFPTDMSFLNITSGTYAQYGFLPGDANTGKENLINIPNYWIGNLGKTYIPNLLRFSNRRGSRPGKKVIINGNPYYIVAWGGTNYDALIIPEEV